MKAIQQGACTNRRSAGLTTIASALLSLHRTRLGTMDQTQRSRTQDVRAGDHADSGRASTEFCI